MAPTPDAAQEAIATVADLVDEAVVYSKRAPITDFARDRNLALARVAKRGYDWAIMLDTDERIHLIPKKHGARDFRAYLGHTPHDILMVRYQSGEYAKERIFRLPAQGHYVGPTHEAFVTDEGASRFTLSEMMTFSEIPKTKEQYRAKVERDRDILEDYVVKHPKDPRWWYYLADTYSGLGKTDDAIETFAACWHLNGWDEESAWAAYRAASLLAEQGSYRKAIEWCVHGLIRRADFPELPWLAGWCAYKQKQYAQAIRWERMAIAMTYPAGERIGFRFLPAHYEAPWDVLRYTYRATGETAMAEMAEERFVQNEEKRTRGWSR